MKHITISGISVFLSKFFSDADIAALKEFLTATNAEVAVFIDTPPTIKLPTAIQVALDMGIEVVVRDHHDVTDEELAKGGRAVEIRTAADAVRTLVPGAVISNREISPACSSLVEIGEFTNYIERVVLVIDPDADGLTACMKALGITYPELDADAAVLDGPHSGQNADTLSSTGFLLVQGMATLPVFDRDRPQIAEGAKADLFSNFVAAVAGDTDARAALETKVLEYNAQVTAAEELLETAVEVVPGVGVIDIRGKRPHIGTLAAGLDKKFMVTVLTKSDGPIAKACGGVQYSLSVRKADQASLDLRTFLPEGTVSSPEAGVISNTSFLLHVSEEKWQEIILPALQARLGG